MYTSWPRPTVNVLKMNLLHVATIPIMFFHWWGWETSLAYVSLFLMSALLTKTLNREFCLNKDVINIIIIIGLFVSINLFHIIGYEDSSIIFSSLNQYLTLFILVALLLITPRWRAQDIRTISQILFWISFYSIAIEFVLVNFAGVPKEIMPGVRFSPSYFADYGGLHRPFGLTGQPSVNGGILLLYFLLLVELRIVHKWVVVALLIGILMTLSGQAILSTMLVFAMFWTVRGKNFIISLTVLFAILANIFLLMAFHPFENVIILEKLTIDYLVYVMWDQANIHHTIGNLSYWELLFGTLKPNPEVGTDVFFVGFVRIFGLVFLFIFLAFIWRVVSKARYRLVWYIAIIVSSAHYPTIIFIEAQLSLALLYLLAFRDRVGPHSRSSRVGSVEHLSLHSDTGRL